MALSGTNLNVCMICKTAKLVYYYLSIALGMHIQKSGQLIKN